ncbi:MAG: Gfo/Idh/MocA family oxidoreductase [Enterococcus avium]|jgi:predicted dehydrogenase|uniref:Gfo/Idh/MocA family protein n=1 Tax=Enterococcus raffinosus TaxID=71452 RepID=UPI001C107590|nr:Gfo/Idh/MocA family oxidoreductase [Enterococcus raffinosus]MBS6070233.1 Gfo/Idh/MocA family oxidoreductase [Enterococcus avium]MBU5363400.1 Gfo/Idh/MocA family oxidoreductase [Enterococcus raffinosus]
MITQWAIAGTGFAASDFISKLDRQKYDVRAVFDINEQALKAYGEKFQVHDTYTDFAEMLDSAVFQGLYIGTPNQTHYPLMLQALKAGKHIICEKVITLNSQQYKHIQSLAEEKELVVIEGITLFYMPLFSKLKQLTDTGDLGRMSGINVTFGSAKAFDPTNRFFDREKGGGALFDIGTYALSALVYFLGTDCQLVFTDGTLSETGVDEKSSFILRNNEQMLGTGMISFRGKLPKQIVLSGEKGYIVVEDFPRAEKATIHWNDGRVEQMEIGNEDQVFNSEIEILNGYARNASETELDVREVTGKVLSIMDQCRKQWGLSYPNEDLLP